MKTSNVENMDRFPVYLQDEKFLRELDGWGYEILPINKNEFGLVVDGILVEKFNGLGDFLGKELDENGYAILTVWETRAMYCARHCEQILNESEDGHKYTAKFIEDTE